MDTKFGYILQPSPIMPLAKNPFRIDIWVFDRMKISGAHPQKSTNESLLDFFRFTRESLSIALLTCGLFRALGSFFIVNVLAPFSLI